MDKIKETIKQLEELKEHCKSVQDIDDCADHTLHIKAIDTVVEMSERLSTIEAPCEQIKWECDTAIKQLESYGVGFCENAEVKKVVHGHWTEKKFPGGGYWDYYFVCSECHHETPNRGYTVAPDYCPGCGAKMDLEDKK